MVSEYLKYVFAKLRMGLNPARRSRGELGSRARIVLHCVARMAKRNAGGFHASVRISLAPSGLRGSPKGLPVLVVRSDPVQRPVLSQSARADRRGLADAGDAALGHPRGRQVLGAQQSLAAARGLRHQGRVPRRGEDSARAAARLLQAPVAVGDVRVVADPVGPRLHHEAGADVDPVLRLVCLEGRHDPGRPQQGRARRSPT